MQRPPARVYHVALGVRKFLGRLAQLDVDRIDMAVQQWRQLVTPRWFAAEEALAHAMQTSGRFEEEEMWLQQMALLFRRQPWFTRASPGASIGASEASAQYVATTAMLALLTRDHLPIEDFDLLYSPFATLIPLDELEPE